MAKIKVKVTNAIVDGKKDGEFVTIDEKSAKHLKSIGYVTYEEKAADDKKEEDK